MDMKVHVLLHRRDTEDVVTLRNRVHELMAPFDLNMLGEPHELPCACAGMALLAQIRVDAERELFGADGSYNATKRFTELPEVRLWQTAQQFGMVVRRTNPSNKHIERAIRMTSDMLDGRWSSFYSVPLENLIRSKIEATPKALFANGDPTCVLCEGRGVYTSGDNPNGRWRRWDFITPGGGNAVRCSTVDSMVEYPDALLTPDGAWSQFSPRRWEVQSLAWDAGRRWYAQADEILARHRGYVAVHLTASV